MKLNGQFRKSTGRTILIRSDSSRFFVARIINRSANSTESGMNNREPEQEEPNRLLSREEILAALDTKPVFEIVTHDAGTINVTPVLAKTLERITVEFERDDSGVDDKLRFLLCQIGRTNGDDGQLTPISDSLVSHVTSVELADFARKLLVSEEWASEDEVVDEPDPKGRVIEALRGEIEAAGASYRKLLDALGPSISAATRASISNATRLADKLRMDIATSSHTFRAIETLQRDGSVAKLATSVAQMHKSIAGEAEIRGQALRLKGTLPSFAMSPVPSRIQSLPPIVNPTAASAKATAESAAKMEQALERLEQRADDSALLIAGIHDMIRDTTLDMARNAQESSAATKQSLDQAAASLAIGVQSLNWAKYALMASVGIGLVGLVFAGISAWYAVFLANTAQSPGTVTETIHAPSSM
ncbi:hypothetical protein OEJ37_25425 [Burkholderia sp. BKH01]|uniref:hypothetical protein n=1 Tax=Burkholderia sp. BKH01 TaxID=2769262 RepID=UPI0021E05AE7|nr:hypothetical protein [Burkholderia sp. BKH01]MCU9956710.1 hypothetical protein [Burkholderia sp. BKH01]